MKKEAVPAYSGFSRGPNIIKYKYYEYSYSIQKTLHSVSLPHVQSDLSTFSQSTPQLPLTNPICIVCGTSSSSQQRCIGTSQIPPAKEKSNQQNCITYTINLHCFLCSFGPTLTMKPKPNLQIATHSNHFPSYYQCNQIISCNLLQHRTSKQTLITLEAWLMSIILHIPQTINMHTKTHSTYSYHHRSSLSIKTQ